MRVSLAEPPGFQQVAMHSAAAGWVDVSGVTRSAVLVEPDGLEAPFERVNSTHSTVIMKDAILRPFGKTILAMEVVVFGFSLLSFVRCASVRSVSSALITLGLAWYTLYYGVHAGVQLSIAYLGVSFSKLAKLFQTIGLAAIFAIFVVGYILYRCATLEPSSLGLGILFVFSCVDAFCLGCYRFTPEDMQALNEAASRRRQRSISSLSDMSEPLVMDECVETKKAPSHPTTMNRLSGFWKVATPSAPSEHKTPETTVVVQEPAFSPVGQFRLDEKRKCELNTMAIPSSPPTQPSRMKRRGSK